MNGTCFTVHIFTFRIPMVKALKEEESFFSVSLNVFLGFLEQ
jgi:hypothetical protein